MKNSKSHSRERVYSLNIRMTKAEYFALKAIAWRSKRTMTAVIVDALPIMKSYYSTQNPLTDGNSND